MRILSDREVLHQAIRADWWDVAPKLAYADWLDEQGGEKDIELATCIRNPLGPKAWVPRCAGEKAHVRWSGGLVWSLSCSEQWLRNVGASFLRLHPVLEVTYEDIVDFRSTSKSTVENRLKFYARRFDGVRFKQTLFRIYNDEQPVTLSYLCEMGHDDPHP